MASKTTSASPIPSSSSSSPPLPTIHRSTAAYNGTFLAGVTYMNADDQNYVLFYQHSNGDIRKNAYNETGWHKPAYVTSSGRQRTTLTVVWAAGDPDKRLYLYYIDKTDTIQELQGFHGSDHWTPGTIGAFGFRTATRFSSLPSIFVGGCANGIDGFVFYQSSDGILREALWNSALDTWTAGNNFTSINPGSGFVASLWKGIRRLYVVSTNSTAMPYECVNCCTEVDWRQRVACDFSNTVAPISGILAIDPEQIAYYQSSDSVIRTANISDNTVDATCKPGPLTLGRAMIGTNLVILQSQTLVKAFYQTVGSDITVTSWLRNDPTRNSTLQLSLEI